jgi:hypothetical protein
VGSGAVPSLAAKPIIDIDIDIDIDVCRARAGSLYPISQPGPEIALLIVYAPYGFPVAGSGTHSNTE